MEMIYNIELELTDMKYRNFMDYCLFKIWFWIDAD